MRLVLIVSLRDYKVEACEPFIYDHIMFIQFESGDHLTTCQGVLRPITGSRFSLNMRLV